MRYISCTVVSQFHKHSLQILDTVRGECRTLQTVLGKTVLDFSDRLNLVITIDGTQMLNARLLCIKPIQPMYEGGVLKQPQDDHSYFDRVELHVFITDESFANVALKEAFQILTMLAGSFGVITENVHLTEH